jgi:hypothetical protein
MAEQIWAPEEEDEVTLKDGRKGRLGDPDSFVWQGGSDWQVNVNVEGELDPDAGEDDEPEVEEVNDISVRPDDKVQGLWVEIGS